MAGQLPQVARLHGQVAHNSNLKNMVTSEPQRFVDSDGQPTPFLKKVIKNLTYSLQALQRVGKAHANLKPACVLLTDSGGVSLQGAIIAVRSDEEYSREVFSLARVLHFCLTGGKSQVAWDANLQALMSLGCLPTEENLLACMLHPQPAARPSLEQVLQHACWWNDKISLDFLAYVSDFLEELGQGNLGLPGQLQECLAMVMGGKGWCEVIEPQLMGYMRSFRKFQSNSWQDLLRFIRNMYHHFGTVYRDASPAMQHVLQPASQGLFRYFAAKFPKLLIATYSFVQQYCIADPDFNFKIGAAMRKPVPRCGRSQTEATGMTPPLAAVSSTPVRSAAGIILTVARLPVIHAAAGSARDYQVRQQVCSSADQPRIWPSTMNQNYDHFQQRGPSTQNCKRNGKVAKQSAEQQWNPSSPYPCAAAKQVMHHDSVRDSSSNLSSSVFGSSVSSSTLSSSSLSSSNSSSSNLTACNVSNCSGANSNLSIGSKNRLASLQSSSQPGQYSGNPAVTQSKTGQARVTTTFQLAVLNPQELRNAIWHFNKLKQTAENACCVGRTFEVGSGGSRNVSQALSWYFKARDLDRDGPIKQYAVQRIAELQEQQAALHGPPKRIGQSK